MANPKNISSYDARLVMIIEQIAQSDEAERVPMELGSHNVAITFGSRFSSLKNLLAKRAEQNENFTLAERIRGCCLRSLSRAPDAEGKLRPTGWYICNSAGGVDHRLNDALDSALETILAKEFTTSAQSPSRHTAELTHEEIREAKKKAALDKTEGSILSAIYGISEPEPEVGEGPSEEDIRAFKEYQEAALREAEEERQRELDNNGSENGEKKS